MRILIVSPFHGSSSHAAWARGWQKHSRHVVEIVELADRAWSWRLKGGCVPLAQKLEQLSEMPDLVVATSLTCVSSLLGILRRSPLARIPWVYYMHENQLTYPIRQGGKRDTQLVLRQFHAQLACDRVWFNSDFNRVSWLRQLPVFLKRFVDHHGVERIPELEARSQVLPVGLELPLSPPDLAAGDPPLLVWSQRWEWEKGVDTFVKLLRWLAPRYSFELALLGSEPRGEIALREELRELLGDRLVCEGWLEREEYESFLRVGSLTVSTARHEFFGISMLEAQAHGMMTMLPNDLAYPEVLPEELHSSCLYGSFRDLTEMVGGFLSEPERFVETRKALQEAAYRYRWSNLVEQYDQAAESLVDQG